MRLIKFFLLIWLITPNTPSILNHTNCTDWTDFTGLHNYTDFTDYINHIHFTKQPPTTLTGYSDNAYYNKSIHYIDYTDTVCIPYTTWPLTTLNYKD